MMRQDTHFRYHILNEIRRLATQTGKPPGQALFARDTLISEQQWKDKFWPGWGDALTEAGFGRKPASQQLNADEVLTRVVEACRAIGKVPTYAEMDEYRRNHPHLPGNRTIAKHFSDRAGLLLALSNLAASNPDYADLKSLLPRQIPATRAPAFSEPQTNDGSVYLIKSGAYYKIGQTKMIEQGAAEPATWLPSKTTLLHTIRTDDPPGIEAYWHNRFKEKRANGEWFKLSPDDIAAFQKRKYQ